MSKKADHQNRWPAFLGYSSSAKGTLCLSDDYSASAVTPGRMITALTVPEARIVFTMF